ncbi:MAG: GIY-YIG nuclease family protein [Patescibacteria group bacterium]
MKYIVYILKSSKSGIYYIGQTKNLKKRMAEHNSGKSKSTKRGIPWNLMHEEIFNTRSEAMKRELSLKNIKKRIILEKLFKYRGVEK